jgi:tRNA-specific 2-thiouridylase
MRILAALSGGVDSAVAAARLVDQGADVVGVHLRTGVEADGQAAAGHRSCCGADDARDARAVAARLGVPFYVVDVRDAFGRVLDAFVGAYAGGLTPNPCIDCNRHVKLGRLRDIAAGLGAEAVATGHYARREVTATGRVRLMRPADLRKDQTYVLYALSQEQLRAARFPLADATKDDVRREAAARGLPVAAKPDSQELCFVPSGDYRAWLREHAPGVLVPGEVVDEDGRTVGRHDGAAGFTVGQRRGLPATGRARYVAAVDAPEGRVTVAPREGLLRRRVRVEALNWVDLDDPGTGTAFEVEARIRHAAPLQAGTLAVTGAGTAEVAFRDPVFAPAPGQALVAYRDGAVLCGGVIRAAAGDADLTRRSA